MSENEPNEESKSEPPAKGGSASGGKDEREQLLRLRADFENTKKRLEREKQESIKYANERLLLEILPILDNLDRAMESLAEGHDAEKVKKGLRLAEAELHKMLASHGVERVKSLGETFDPNLHEAVAAVESDHAKDGTIVDEVQRGYTLNGRLVRPSRVRIAQKKV